MTPKIFIIIAEKLGVDQSRVVPQALLVDDLGADSLDLVELVMAFEDQYEIEIPDSDFERIKTVEDVEKLLRVKGIAL